MNKRATQVSVTVMVVALAAVSAQAGLPFAAKGHSSNYIVQDTRVKNLAPFFFQSPFFPALADQTKVTTIVKRSRQFETSRAKGAINNSHSCFNQLQQNRSFGRSRAKFDAFGNAATVKTIAGSADCIFHQTQTSFKGNQKQDEGSSVSTINAVQRIPQNADPDCFDLNTLCLNNSRFKADLNWNDGSSSGTAVPVATGFDEGLFFFFDPKASALLISVLDGCKQNNAWAVFATVGTDVEYTLTVTDTETNQVRTYSNPLGMPAEAITDTQAFATCP